MGWRIRGARPLPAIGIGAASVVAWGCSGAALPDRLPDDPPVADASSADAGAGGPGSPPPAEAGPTCTGRERAPADFLFVLDGSGSMNADNKWTSVRPALESVFAQMATAADPGVAAGLLVFSDSNDPTEGMGPYPSSADVPLAFVSSAQASALDERLDGDAEGATPTHAALSGGYGELARFRASGALRPGGKKVLVLITDGVPSDDCAPIPILGGYATNACIVLAGNELAEDAIQTFVVGVGNYAAPGFFGNDGLDPTFLGNLAVAGGTGVEGCDPTATSASDTSAGGDLCYFAIDTSQAPTAEALEGQFEAALDAIRGQAEACPDAN